MRDLHIADLFCGAGGTSTGAVQACQDLGLTPRITAINHWDVAVATHSSNHPGARHLCASVDTLNPRHLFAEGELDVLWGSPECTHHSVARGGKPINDQSRATAWCVTRWAEALRPSVVLVENVQEFEDWGPIDSRGRPVKSRKGEVFHAWVNTLRALGYTVDWRVLCAADYGDPTTRRRLFVQAVRGRRRIVWPEATHTSDPGETLWDAGRKPWRAAREIIDWSIPGRSVFTRERPLSSKTMARIMAGLQKYGLRSVDHRALVEPFLISMEHGQRLRSVDEPLNTVTTAKGGAHALVEPFILPQQSMSIARPASQPVPTIATSGCIALVEPYLVKLRGECNGAPLGQPAPTITAGGKHLGLAEPFLVKFYSSVEQLQPVSRPLDTVTTKARFGLAEPTVEIRGERYTLDIRFRMLQPHELSAAQGFPADYQFTGTRSEVVKQIGNAVPCGLARALVRSCVSQKP